ncbi:plasmid stabilization system protein [bacterium BMS3Bbin12]|nr:plasmid stabilization system protein [bacterium BMS3Bbin12]GBE50291.1 plasmid stabilization system protein [bacterium BMS3Bbin13]
MKLIVHLREEADGDLAVAASWYEQQRVGLGHEFLDEALSAFRLIAKQPLLYPIVRRNTRRALMHRFPFGIFYRVENSHIVVVAVMHGSRHPYHWQARK